MSVGVLSGTVNKKTIEVVFESSYVSSGIENTFSLGGKLNVSQMSGGLTFNIAGFTIGKKPKKPAIKVLTFDSLQRDGSGRWATHEIIGQDRKPLLEFIGPDLETLSFSIFLSSFLGTSPEEELLKLRSLRDNGAICDFIIGGRLQKKWIIKSLSEAHKAIDKGGNLLVATVNVSMTEYVKLPKE